MLNTVSARMETMGIHLDASNEAVAELAKEGFDPKYGARPLRRAIQSKVEDAVAEKMLDGTLKAGDTAKLTVEDDKLCVTKERKRTRFPAGPFFVREVVRRRPPRSKRRRRSPRS